MPVSAVVNWSYRDDEVLFSIALRWESAGGGQTRYSKLVMECDGSFATSSYTAGSYAGDSTLVRTGFIQGTILDNLPGEADKAATRIYAAIPDDTRHALPARFVARLTGELLAFFEQIGRLLNGSLRDVDAALDALPDDICRSVATFPGACGG